MLYMNEKELAKLGFKEGWTSAKLNGGGSLSISNPQIPIAIDRISELENKVIPRLENMEGQLWKKKKRRIYIKKVEIK